MDLTVEIEGDIGRLEEALRKFTSTEILDGDNKYLCGRLVFIFSLLMFVVFTYIMFDIFGQVRPSTVNSLSLQYIYLTLISTILFRCKSYVRAKKKLKILEAPNILTVVLKRFQVLSFNFNGLFALYCVYSCLYFYLLCICSQEILESSISLSSSLRY